VDACHDVSNFKLRARTFPKAGLNFTLNPSRENYLWLNILLAVSPLQTIPLSFRLLPLSLLLSLRIRNEELTMDREKRQKERKSKRIT
jgi:hypothetical protein